MRHFIFRGIVMVSVLALLSCDVVIGAVGGAVNWREAERYPIFQEGSLPSGLDILWDFEEATLYLRLTLSSGEFFSQGAVGSGVSVVFYDGERTFEVTVIEGEETRFDEQRFEVEREFQYFSKEKTVRLTVSIHLSERKEWSGIISCDAVALRPGGVGQRAVEQFSLMLQIPTTAKPTVTKPAAPPKTTKERTTKGKSSKRGTTKKSGGRNGQSGKSTKEKSSSPKDEAPSGGVLKVESASPMDGQDVKLILCTAAAVLLIALLYAVATRRKRPKKEDAKEQDE